jgi:hypothetical protein
VSVLVKLLVDLSAASGPREAYVPLDAGEIAQRDTDEKAAADAGTARSAAAQEKLRSDLIGKCDRYLAQTDWIMLPESARPVDMDQALAATIDANVTAWRAWRQEIRVVRADADAGTADLTAPLPPQPSDPHVQLT